MSYPQQFQGQPPQGYPMQAPPQQFAQPQQAYADPNAAQQYPPQGYAPAPGQQPMTPQFQAPPAQQFPGQPQQGYPMPGQQQPQHFAVPAEVEDTADMFGGAPSISWDVAKGYVLGTPRGGLVLSKRKTQQTDATTKAPKFYQGSNQPMMQLELTLQTREKTDATDDGKRKMYVKGLMLKSARTAFEAHGVNDIEVGSYFYAANTAKNGGKNGMANLFECVYARPGQPDPLGHLPAYVAPQLAAPAQPQQQFVPPQQPNYPVPGQQPAWNPYGQPQQQAPAAQGIPQSLPGQQQPAPNPGVYGPNAGQQFAPGPYDQAAQMAAPGQQQATAYGLPQSAIQEHAGQVNGGPPAGYNPFSG